MNASIQRLVQVAGKETKRIIGLMSGTSLDGLDIALCRINGHGFQTDIELQYFKTVSYGPGIKEQLRKIVSVPTVDMEELCLSHSRLGTYHGELVLEALRDWKVKPEDIDCLASHGQTVYHAPRIQHGREGMPNATLQLGDGDHLARKTGILTVSDFRQKHTAAGGEGAPMAALADRLLFRHEQQDRLLLNIGGIANFTMLPALDSGDDAVTADTGPGNTLINAAMESRFGRPYDESGETARRGTVDVELYKQLKSHPYFEKDFPRTTGPEVFNLGWVREQAGEGVDLIPPEDLVATLSWLTAETIADAIWKVSGDTLPEVYVSGGGMYNRQLMEWISELLEGHPIHSFEEIGFDPDAKEAVSFAILANETLSGDGFFIDPKQNAGRRVGFGKISLPV